MALGLGFVLVAVPFIIVLIGTGLRRGAGVTAIPEAVRLREVARTTARWRTAGLLLGAALAWWVAKLDILGRGLMLTAPVLGLSVLLGVVMGELRVCAPSGSVRTAELEVRRIRDYLPRRLTPVVAAALLALAVLLAFATIVGSPDDLGRPGRALTGTCQGAGEGTYASTTSATPWPGSFYALPLAAAVVGGLLAGGVALLHVARRPRQGEDRPVDEALRANATGAVVAALGVLVGIPLAGVSAVSAAALGNVSCTPTAWHLLVPVLALLAPIALAFSGWCVAVLVRPLRLPAPSPSTAAGAGR